MGPKGCFLPWGGVCFSPHASAWVVEARLPHRFGRCGAGPGETSALAFCGRRRMFFGLVLLSFFDVEKKLVGGGNGGRTCQTWFKSPVWRLTLDITRIVSMVRRRAGVVLATYLGPCFLEES